jgi:hypothetical protein
MGRKTGANASVLIELGSIAYPMAALTSVSSPASDVNKKFETQAEYISDLSELQADVRVDGVLSGFSLAPGASFNEVDVAAGKLYLKGQLVEVSATTVTGLTRPTTQGQVLVTALTVDDTGTINKTAGTEGATSTSRGAAGGPPFLPIDEVLIGYVTATYYDGSASGEKVLTAGEIDSYTKERAAIPSAKVLHHDGDDGGTNKGCVVLANALPEIHAATAAGPGTDVRNVYASYYEPEFEEVPDAKDFSFDEDIATYKSKAYKDASEETSIGTPSWSGTFSAYFSSVEDVLNLVKNSKRWIKHFPDSDLTDHWSGRCVIKVGRESPVEDNLMATVTLEGSGKLYPKAD